MFKSFPVCLDGDQFTVRFDYKEEQTAFESVVSKLHTILKDYKGGKQQIKSSDIFSTTLQKEVSEDTVAAIMKIFNLDLFNIFDDVTIINRYM